MRHSISMGSDSAKRFVELVIATTIGSIVGAYIARDIQFNLNLFIRALFATCLLAIFFFFVWQFSTHIGKHRNERPRRYTRHHHEEPEETEMPYSEEESYEEYRENGAETNSEAELQEDFEEPDESEKCR